MKILSYIIPKQLQKNHFVQSLHKQFEEKGKLSPKQAEALEDILEITLDFYDWKYEPKNEELQEDWDNLLAKLTRNRFRSVKNRNKCIRALESIIAEMPRWDLIDEALGKNYNYGYRRW